jgi:hypothetical protein
MRQLFGEEFFLLFGGLFYLWLQLTQSTPLHLGGGLGEIN